MTPNPDRAIEVFTTRFGNPPAAAARAPGRVNLIGEHIDYLGGDVLPMAIDAATLVLLAPNDAGRFRLTSENIAASETQQIALEAIASGSAAGWIRYPAGVISRFIHRGFEVPNLDLYVESTVPEGAGLSSSAALEVAVALALDRLLNVSLNRMEIALLAQEAEREYVGVPCGPMDQFASACARPGHALRLDCRWVPPASTTIPVPQDAGIVIAHCGVARNLDQSAYARRRQECQSALDAINAQSGREDLHLSRIPLELLEAWEARSPRPAALVRRARHACTEERRVEECCRALEQGDLPRAGTLMNESHFSLRDDFEVSCPELDQLTALARSLEGVYGSRLTGAGFGGCTVTLADRSRTDDIVEALIQRYYKPRNIDPLVLVTRPAAGAEPVEVATASRGKRNPA